MRIKRVFIKNHKNLKEFTISFNDKQKVVLLGQNASGKSNFLEALIIIFRDLHFDEDPKFDFSIEYSIEDFQIFIQGNTAKNLSKYVFIKYENNNSLYKDDFDSIWKKVENKEKIKGNISREEFCKKFKLTYENRENINPYLPKRIFVYYSGLGNSNRLEPLFDRAEDVFSYQMRTSEEVIQLPLRPLFYVKLHHYHFVMLAFYAFKDKVAHEFLSETLCVDGLESILFVLREPSYSKNKKEGNPKFWHSEGVVNTFLEELWAKSLAPIRMDIQERINYWRETKKEKLFLFLPNIDRIADYIQKKQWKEIDFFNVLDSINASDLRDSIQIRVKKRFAKDIDFKALSEGEQQLLTVLGLMRFTSDENSLYLLDEPDTHLNPLWKWQYMSFIDRIAKTSEKSQVIMTSHDPLTIGSLTKEEVRVFYTDSSTGKIETYTPEEDPRGLGVEGLLTSPIFGLSTVLDIPTKKDVERRDELYSKKYYDKIELSEKEENDLEKLSNKLENIGYKTSDTDPIYAKFLRAYRDKFKDEDKSKLSLSPEEIEERNRMALEILKSILEEENQ